mmetsp:Transcript_5925/g.10157  ORF Transcript_5925/g.10157 Transcript_5925/m.10157 type:complete len:241 (+) Transcript_5925:42-764(+)
MSSEPILVSSLAKFLSLTDNRDKVVKFVIYGSRFYGHFLRSKDPKSEWAPIMTKIEQAASTSRKLFRFAKSANVISKTLKNQEQNPWIRFVNRISDAGLFWYFLFDNFSLLASLSVLSLDPTRMGRIAEMGYFVSCVSDLALDARSLLLANAMHEHLMKKKLGMNSTGIQEDSERLRIRQALHVNAVKHKTLVLNIVKNLADLVIAWNIVFMRLRMSPRHTGLAGVVSAGVAMYQGWPAP